jgi:hypothetical protein
MQNSEVNQLEHQVRQKQSLSLELYLVQAHILSTARDALMGFVKSISAPKKNWPTLSCFNLKILRKRTERFGDGNVHSINGTMHRR